MLECPFLLGVHGQSLASTTHGSQTGRVEKDYVSRKHNFLILSELPSKIASFIGRNTDSFRGFTADSM